jgi:hypothetical protein
MAQRFPQVLEAAAASFVRALISYPFFAAMIAIALIIVRSTSGMSQAMYFTPML